MALWLWGDQATWCLRDGGAPCLLVISYTHPMRYDGHTAEPSYVR